MIRFGLVSFAHVHSDGYAWALKRIHDDDQSAQLVAISDPQKKRGEPKAKEWNAKYFEDYKAMMKSGEVDAVIISSENARHVDEVVAAAEAGIHIICEKPVAISTDHIKRMREALAQHSLVFQTAFVCRYAPPVVEAKQLIDSGTYGAIRAISSTNHGRYPGGWFGEKEQSGGGAVIDHTVHAADAIRMLTGDEFINIRAFKGKNLRKDINVEDNALIYARLEKSGVPVSIDCSWSRHDKWPTWGDLQLSIFCEKGVIKVDAFRPRINVASKDGFTWHSLGEDLNAKLIRSFCEAVRAQTGKAHPPRVPCSTHNEMLRANFEDGARAAAVAIAAYESIGNNSEPVIPTL
jgi:UDP-N-acetylglucosamine 3-dehydrogenase